MTDDMPKNSESQMLSLVNQMDSSTFKNQILFKMVVGKVGYVYQSANFLYGVVFLKQIYM